MNAGASSLWSWEVDSKRLGFQAIGACCSSCLSWNAVMMRASRGFEALLIPFVLPRRAHVCHHSLIISYQ